MIRKLIACMLVFFFACSPAYASSTSGSMYNLMSLSDDGIMTALSGDYSSAMIAGAVYYVGSDSFDITTYNSDLSDSISNKLGAVYFNQTDMNFDSASPFVGYALKFNGMSSSVKDSTWSITLNHLMLFYRALYNGSNVYLNINPAFTAPAQAVAICQWSGSGYLPSSSGGSGSWATLSGTVELPVNVSASDVALQNLASFSPRFSGNVNMQVTFDLPDTVTEDGYTYEVRSGSVTSMQIYVVYPFRPSNLFDYSGIPITDNYPGFDTNGLSIIDFSRLLYANGEPKLTVLVSSGGQSSNGLSQSIGNIGQSIAQLQQNVTKQINEVKTTIRQGANDVKNEISNQTQSITDSLTDVKDSIVDSITDLPTKMQEMLTDFIVPDEDAVADKMSDFQSLAEEKLGIIYQVPEMMFDAVESLVGGVSNPQSSMTFPAFSLPWIDGSQLKVWDSQQFDIIPAGLDNLRDLIQTVTSMVFVIMTFNSFKRAYERFFLGGDN